MNATADVEVNAVKKKRQKKKSVARKLADNLKKQNGFSEDQRLDHVSRDHLDIFDISSLTSNQIHHSSNSRKLSRKDSSFGEGYDNNHLIFESTSLESINAFNDLDKDHSSNQLFNKLRGTKKNSSLKLRTASTKSLYSKLEEDSDLNDKIDSMVDKEFDKINQDQHLNEFDHVSKNNVTDSFAKNYNNHADSFDHETYNTEAYSKKLDRIKKNEKEAENKNFSNRIQSSRRRKVSEDSNDHYNSHLHTPDLLNPLSKPAPRTSVMPPISVQKTRCKLS